MAKVPNAGDLRERVDIQSATKAHVEGHETTTFATVSAGVPAHVREESGGERIRAGRVESHAAVIVTMRARAIDPGQRLLWRGEVLQVHGTGHPDPQRRWIELTCTKTE